MIKITHEELVMKEFGLIEIELTLAGRRVYMRVEADMPEDMVRYYRRRANNAIRCLMDHPHSKSLIGGV